MCELRSNSGTSSGSWQRLDPGRLLVTHQARDPPWRVIAEAFDLDVSGLAFSTIRHRLGENMTMLREPIQPPPPNELKVRIQRGDEAGLLRLSNLWTRAIIGMIGIVLPVFLIAGEAFFLRGGVHVRGSLSAYYHTSMRDIFVAGLCVTGFFLATYMAGTKTRDFWLSLVAGLAVIGVVFFPTMRPHLLPDARGVVSRRCPTGAHLSSSSSVRGWRPLFISPSRPSSSSALQRCASLCSQRARRTVAKGPRWQPGLGRQRLCVYADG
jgi:hypothetical protein